MKTAITFVLCLMLSQQPLSICTRAKGCHILFANDKFMKNYLDGFLEIFSDWEEIVYKIHFCNCHILNIDFGTMGHYCAFYV